jgi:hypothetical protein
MKFQFVETLEILGDVVCCWGIARFVPVATALNIRDG